MLFEIARLCVIAGCLFAVIYGIYALIRGFRCEYFSIALTGIVALLLSRLFFYILSASNGDDTQFSVGVFGQISAYMFFSLANCAYIPEHNNKKGRFRLKAFAAALIPDIIYIMIALMNDSISGIFCEILYVLCVSSAVYYSVLTITERKSSRYCSAVVGFNVCVWVLVYINAFNEIAVLPELKNQGYVSIVLAVLSGIIIAVMLPLLKKGLDKQEAEK